MRGDLEGVDEGHVVGGDVVVVLLDVAERLLVVPHQRVNLRALSFVELVQFGLSTQVVLSLQRAQLRLVLRLDLASVTLVFVGQCRHVLGVRLRDTVRRRFGVVVTLRSRSMTSTYGMGDRLPAAALYFGT